jgi:hypothetical protein
MCNNETLDLRGTRLNIVMHPDTTFTLNPVFKDEAGEPIDMTGSDIKLYINNTLSASVGSGITISGSDVTVIAPSLPDVGDHTYYLTVTNGVVSEKLYGKLSIRDRK